MRQAYELLIDYWKSQNIRIANGENQTALREFEKKNAVVLPPDLWAYFLNLNGMPQIGGQDCDQRGFAFWPLIRVNSVAEECAKQSVPIRAVDKPNEYFVFADYMQWSWAYAIYLGPSGPNQVIHVGTVQPKVVAGSFTEFVGLYVRDAKDLYIDSNVAHDKS